MKHRLYLQKISQKGALSTVWRSPEYSGCDPNMHRPGWPHLHLILASWAVGGLWVPRFHLMKGGGDPDRHQQPF